MTDPPTFSIVIPTYDRPAQLAVCLQACARLDYPHDCFEVIVVDDGGTAPLGEVMAQIEGACSFKLLRQENCGPAAARNRGVAEARGEFLAFTDDDCSPAATWLKTLAAQFIASPGCGVGGQTLNGLAQNIYSNASQLLIAYLFSHYNAVPHEARFLPTNNLALPASLFRDIGGFDVTYPRAAAEDRELCDRWLHHGYRMIYDAKAVVRHSHDLTFLSFLRQHFHYGRGACCFHRVRALRRHDRIRLEPPSFYLNLIRYPRADSQGANVFAMTLLIAITQLAHAAGFIWEQVRARVASPALSARHVGSRPSVG